MAGGDGGLPKTPLLLEQMGKTFFSWARRAAASTKAANQIAVAGATAAYTEAILYAEKQGSTRKKCWTPSAAGRRAAGRSPTWRRALLGDFAPGFFVKHFIKDMKIIHDETAGRGVTRKCWKAMLALYTSGSPRRGGENDGTQALIKFYREQSST